MCGLFAVGCGGHHAPTQNSSDDLSYLEIARASGSLRAGVVSVAVGRERRIAKREEITSAARLVAQLHPRDGDLIAARRTADEALHAALSARSDPLSQRVAAKGALRSTDVINGRLRRYAARHPSVQSLIPD